MTRFAEGTVVLVERSRAEIEKLLTRYGASRFASGWDQKGATIIFEAKGRRVRFMLPLPDLNDEEFQFAKSRTTYASPVKRSSEAAQKFFDAEVRRRWRALALVIKSKLEAVDSGISEFEAEFLAHIVLPGGATVGEWVGPQLEDIYATGNLPPLLTSGGQP